MPDQLYSLTVEQFFNKWEGFEEKWKEGVEFQRYFTYAIIATSGKVKRSFEISNIQLPWDIEGESERMQERLEWAKEERKKWQKAPKS